MTALVAVSAAIFAIDKPYSYCIPEDMIVLPGMRVIVPFGRGNRRSEGIVLDVKDEPGIGLKAVAQVMDAEPLMTESAIRMAAFVRERYFCTFYDAIKAMLPAGLWFSSEAYFERSKKSAENAKLSEPELSMLRTIEDSGGKMWRNELVSLFETDPEPLLQNLVKKGYLRTDLDFVRRIHDKKEQIVSLAVPAEIAMEYGNKRQRSAPVQYELLKLLCAVGSGSTKELCYLTGATGQTIKRLQQLGYVSCDSQDVFRSSLPVCVEPAEPITLSEEQSAAFSALTAQSSEAVPGVSLLYGVTGSGKTAVYIKLIQQTLDRGKGALFLVPEIALTPQLIGLLMSHFGDNVCVLHSALRVSERHDTWKKIKAGLSRVVIGTRSAVFAPISDLGLIIVDEEQEHSYKSENCPRYHAKEVAIYRGAKEGALVILGSATPSVETMHLARNGVYSLNVLSCRYNGKHLPTVEIVDMKQELRNGNSTDLSRPLLDAIGRNIEDGKQSILFLNRRGAGRSTICVECGEVMQCPRCSVNLTYHRANRRMMCHYCGYSQPVTERCETCGGRIKIIGTGTQKVESELLRVFPDIQILRMDADTISASNTHEMILNRFRDEKIPVLIGTQMVAKGLNFENVTLVGVIDADMSLYIDHYRAAETTFSMLTQVIGRSGRGSHAGKAIIQTMTPEHTVIRLASQQDYDGFYELENTLRRMQHCPPYGDMIIFTFTSAVEETAVSAAYDFRAMLAHADPSFGLRLLGPSPAAIAKVNQIYRYRLTVSCNNSKPVRLLLAGALKEFQKNKKYKGVSAYADINPYE